MSYPKISNGKPKERLNFQISQAKEKKHFWGHNGKDYGFFESPNKQQFSYNPETTHQIREKLYKNHTPSLQPSYLQEELQKFKSSHLNNEMKKSYWKHKDNHQSSNHYGSLKKANEPHDPQNFSRKINNLSIETEPSERKIRYNPDQFLQNYHQKSKKQQKLNVFSKNIDIYLPKMSTRKAEDKFNQSQINDNYFEVKSNRYQRVKTEADDYKNVGELYQMNRGNRQNNPTFCNSLGYPLPCFRRVQ